jgi:hypothetical protein
MASIPEENLQIPARFLLAWDQYIGLRTPGQIKIERSKMSPYAELQRSESIKSAGPYAEYVEQLFAYFDELNKLHFKHQLEYPFLQLAIFNEPNGGTDFLGFCDPPSGRFVTGRIGVDARVINFCSLVDKMEIAKDCLVHEAIHLAYFMQNWGRPVSLQSNYHGFSYACKCNEIGRVYNWKKVRSSRKFSQKKVRYTLNCETWPHHAKGNLTAENDYRRVSCLIRASRLEARRRVENPSFERDALAVKACFGRLLEKASTAELKAEVFELHRTLSIHGKIDFVL